MSELLSAMCEGEFERVLTLSVSRQVLGSKSPDSQLSIIERIHENLAQFVEKDEHQEAKILRSVQWRMQDFIKGGFSQFVPGRDGTPALKKVTGGPGGGGGGGVPTLFSSFKKKFESSQFSRVRVSLYMYMTNLSDKQASMFDHP